MIMWVAPIGAFGAIAAVVGETGMDALKSLARDHARPSTSPARSSSSSSSARVLKVATGINIFSLLRYLGREFLLILSTSSSESALPRLIAKMEHAGRRADHASASSSRPATRSTSTAPRST